MITLPAAFPGGAGREAVMMFIFFTIVIAYKMRSGFHSYSFDRPLAKCTA
jgi:hypothetical protein